MGTFSLRAWADGSSFSRKRSFSEKPEKKTMVAHFPKLETDSKGTAHKARRQSGIATDRH
jgi:predicted protein tyrosine phosphatase